MLSATAVRVLAPLSVTAIIAIYKYFKSGGKTELHEAIGVPLNPGGDGGGSNLQTDHPRPGFPPASLPDHPPSDLVTATLDEIRKLDPAVLAETVKILNLDPAILDQIRNLDPAVLDENSNVIVDEVQRLRLQENQGGEVDTGESSNGRVAETENGAENENRNENGGGVAEKSTKDKYAVRFEAGECWTYLKSGTCKLGSKCKFKHPPRTQDKPVSKNKGKEKDKFAKKPRQTDSKNDFRSEGKAQTFSHSRGQHSVAPVRENFMGLPIRPGEKNCPFYMQNLSCKYGEHCRFNHPDPVAAEESDPQSRFRNGGCGSFQGASPSKVEPWSAPRSVNETIYESGKFTPLYAPPTNSATKTNVSEQSPQRKQVDELEERPGRPVSKSNCKYRGQMKRSVSEIIYETSTLTPLYVPPTNSATETNVSEQSPQQKQVEELAERSGRPVSKTNCKYRGQMKRSVNEIIYETSTLTPLYVPPTNSATETNVYEQSPQRKQVEELSERPGRRRKNQNALPPSTQ